MQEFTLMRTEADVDDVITVENACFRHPWSKESMMKELDNPAARFLMMKEDGRIIAYAGVWFILDEGHIANIAVMPEYRGKGNGRRIVEALIRLAADSGMSFLTLECRRSNTVAQNLYHSLGFKDVGFRKRYYENVEDALIMYLQPLPEGNPDNDPFLITE